MFCIAVVVAAAITDLRRRRVYDWLTLPSIVIGVVGNLFLGGVMGNDENIGLLGSLCGLGLCFIPMILLWRLGGIGGGDVKLLSAVGAILGWRLALDVMFASFITAAFFAVILILRSRLTKQTFNNIGRYVFRKMSKEDKIKMSQESPKLPFAVAVAVGVIAVIIFRELCV